MDVAEREGELRRNLLQDAAGASSVYRRCSHSGARRIDAPRHAAAAMGAAPPDDGAPLSLGDNHFDQKSARRYTFVKTPEEAAAMKVLPNVATW